jgi:hypothetical protein
VRSLGGPVTLASWDRASILTLPASALTAAANAGLASVSRPVLAHSLHEDREHFGSNLPGCISCSQSHIDAWLAATHFHTVTTVRPTPGCSHRVWSAATLRPPGIASSLLHPLRPLHRARQVWTSTAERLEICGSRLRGDGRRNGMVRTNRRGTIFRFTRTPPSRPRPAARSDRPTARQETTFPRQCYRGNPKSRSRLAPRRPARAPRTARDPTSRHDGTAAARRAPVSVAALHPASRLLKNPTLDGGSA